ncbi:hypothetical protein GWI33_010713, partial [Rhynchophorus ferrugineus]
VDKEQRHIPRPPNASAAVDEEKEPPTLSRRFGMSASSAEFGAFPSIFSEKTRRPIN